MKDRMTYNMIHVVRAPSRGMATHAHRAIGCFLVLSIVSPGNLANAETAESCALHVVSQEIQELQGSRSRALVVTDRIPTISYKQALNGGMPKLKDAPFYEFETPDGNYIAVVDLSSPKAWNHPRLRPLLEDWNAETDKGLRRLPQFQHLPPGSFNSLDLPERTAAIIKTTTSVNDGPAKTIGGIRVVFTRSKDEALPLHEEFPDEPRVDKSAEPGRLFGPGNVQLFLHFAMRVIKESAGTLEIKVHTSESHNILYRRSGAKTDNIFKRDDKHWLLRFGRMHVKEIIKKTKKVLEINVS